MNEEAEVITFEEAFQEFLAEKEACNLSQATIGNYIQSMNYFMIFHELAYETNSPKEINPSHFYKWANTMKLDGVEPASINHFLRDTRAFFYWCMDSDRGYIEEPFKIKMIEKQEEQLKLFTDEEIEALLEKPKKYDGFTTWRTWAIVNWVLATGNRAATIVDVKISDIDIKTKEITLQHTKNKKAQIIPLSSSLETVLKEYLRMWRKGASKDSYLFCNIGEDKLTTNALRKSFRVYCLDRGVERTNIHGLRHNFAKGWVKNNGNMFALQKVLGHSSLDMTRRYVKLYGEDIKEDYDKYNPLDTIKRSGRRTQTVRKANWWE